MTSRRTSWNTAIVVIALVWSGMLFGVSFLATPAKFLAPSLTLPVALDVGRQTFGVFSKIEIVAAAVLVAAAVMVSDRRCLLALAAIVALLVAFQVLFLLPALDERVGTVLQGGMPEPSRLHGLYIVVEVAKLPLLALAAWFGGPNRTAARRNAAAAER